MELGVGKDIFAVCGKCGDTWHVIVALEGAKVTKVQCKFCSGYHRFKRSPNDPSPMPAPPKKVAATRTATGAKKVGAKKTTRANPQRDEPLIEPDLAMPVRDYAMSETYRTGERIEHPKFGQGVVESFPSPGKMNVFFEDGRRTLAFARPAASATM
ncbi:MAG: hypothetical protein JNK45_32700 [Myxococcales bacterium]|jgi:hypothetical protein|nr:hypothetical protein [Myxococcales bacterium]